MGVYIKGMEMPKSCLDCPFMVSRDNDDCILQSEEANGNFENWEQMKSGCPLVPVPPHGRLIDADALGADLLYDAELCARALDSGDIVDSKEAEDLQWQKDCKQNCAYYLTNAETIIEAEEGE